MQSQLLRDLFPAEATVLNMIITPKVKITISIRSILLSSKMQSTYFDNVLHDAVMA